MISDMLMSFAIAITCVILWVAKRVLLICTAVVLTVTIIAATFVFFIVPKRN